MATLDLSRHVDAGPDDAFRAWTDAGALARWWWPQWPDTSYQLDVRPGGGYRIENARIGIGVRGDYTELDPPSTLTMTWIWLTDGCEAQLDGVPVVDTVAVTFLAAADGTDGTDVTVRHTSVSDLTDVAQAWNDVLDRLPAHLAAG